MPLGQTNVRQVDLQKLYIEKAESRQACADMRASARRPEADMTPEGALLKARGKGLASRANMCPAVKSKYHCRGIRTRESSRAPAS